MLCSGPDRASHREGASGRLVSVCLRDSVRWASLRVRHMRSGVIASAKRVLLIRSSYALAIVSFWHPWAPKLLGSKCGGACREHAGHPWEVEGGMGGASEGVSTSCGMSSAVKEGVVASSMASLSELSPGVLMMVLGQEWASSQKIGDQTIVTL